MGYSGFLGVLESLKFSIPGQYFLGYLKAISLFMIVSLPATCSFVNKVQPNLFWCCMTLYMFQHGISGVNFWSWDSLEICWKS